MENYKINDIREGNLIKGSQFDNGKYFQLKQELLGILGADLNVKGKKMFKGQEVRVDMTPKVIGGKKACYQVN